MSRLRRIVKGSIIAFAIAALCAIDGPSSGIVITSEARNLLLFESGGAGREQQVPHGLNFTPTSAKATLVGDPGSAIRDDNSQTAAVNHQVTFNRDIAPIVFHYCALCHRPGEAGPFPLLTYDDVKKHGNQIAAVTATHFMPPWLPEPQALKFADERRLSVEQIALIQKWVEQGMQQESWSSSMWNCAAKLWELSREGDGSN